MNDSTAPPVQPGFTDPVHDSQACFRAILEALSRPGRPVLLRALPALTTEALGRFWKTSRSMTSSQLVPPPLPPMEEAGSCAEAGASTRDPLSPDLPLRAAIAVALTLCDADTPLWLDPSLDTPALRRHLRFHCGCPIVSRPAQALFALIGDPAGMPRLAEFPAGEAAYPDRSATLVILADSRQPGEGGWSVFGPGVSGERYPGGLPFGVRGLPDWFLDDWARNHAAYPLGVDVLFAGAHPGAEAAASANGTAGTHPESEEVASSKKNDTAGAHPPCAPGSGHTEPGHSPAAAIVGLPRSATLIPAPSPARRLALDLAHNPAQNPAQNPAGQAHSQSRREEQACMSQ